LNQMGWTPGSPVNVRSPMTHVCLFEHIHDIYDHGRTRVSRAGQFRIYCVSLMGRSGTMGLRNCNIRYIRAGNNLC